MRRLLAALASLAALHAVAASWMSLGIAGVPPPLQQEAGGLEAEDPAAARARAVCSALRGLVPQQVQECMQRPDAIFSVAAGARRAIQECQYQFRNERWNCTTRADDQNVFGNILKRGSKETAFVYAVTSAGVVHAATQACSAGNLTDCSCDARLHGHATPEGWKWGGCSDNVEYGLLLSRRFVDAAEKRPPPAHKPRAATARTQMNLHNNEAGRQVVASLMRVQCRCHGISGSCELKTCWKTMPSFNEVGDTLKRKYRQAVQQVARKRLRRKSKGRLVVGPSDLVHIHKSPNYCVHNAAEGVAGTGGRVCNKTSPGPDSCHLLCCGRGYNTQVMKHAERCHCKFVWCCHVRCKTCETQVDRHTCK